MHENICAWLDAAIAIVDIDLYVQRSRVEIDRVRVAHDRSLKCFSREFIQRQCCFGAVLRCVGVDFRYGDIDAQPIHRRHVKQFLRHRRQPLRTAGPRVNECADVRISRRDHA